MATITTNPSVRDAFFANFRALTTDLLKTATQYRQYTQTVRELSTLTNAELDDLGFSRSQIKSVSHQAVYGH